MGGEGGTALGLAFGNRFTHPNAVCYIFFPFPTANEPCKSSGTPSFRFVTTCPFHRFLFVSSPDTPLALPFFLWHLLLSWTLLYHNYRHLSYRFLRFPTFSTLPFFLSFFLPAGRRAGGSERPNSRPAPSCSSSHVSLLSRLFSLLSSFSALGSGLSHPEYRNPSTSSSFFLPSMSFLHFPPSPFWNGGSSYDSMFSVQCSMLGVWCSMFGVWCWAFGE